ncbi:RNA polymerase sigma24 factor [Nocardia camponoti]|uniref:RNA polymerase sigma24 factor n=2 Tax=Nocardia camponoti TaxID=1616106 RepID=A0A917VD04_9NOCA|nr:RNA polymerase sigma24 factor [Nocardia camponoti]
MAEDAVQEALLAAATQWPVDGVPTNPRAWLIQVAQRRMADAVRVEVARRSRETAVFEREVRQEAAARDDSLDLYFLCCHPELPAASAVALTLRAVGGLTTAEIAAAFLVPEATMAQRVSRAKKRLSQLSRPFGSGADDTKRMAAVLRVLYVIFTEAHTSSSSPELRRADLAAEAIRLTRALHELVPTDPEVTSLLALMLLTDSRRAARTGPHGELIPLPAQDRTLWDRAMTSEGLRLVTATMSAGLSGSYQLQAAIAGVHAQATTADATDWTTILALYSRLEQVEPSAIVTLNRAVALAAVEGPSAGLALVDTIADELSGNHRLAAVRGHLTEMSGDTAAAVTHYHQAATQTTSAPERDYLLLRAARLRNPEEAPDDENI